MGCCSRCRSPWQRKKRSWLTCRERSRNWDERKLTCAMRRLLMIVFSRTYALKYIITRVPIEAHIQYKLCMLVHLTITGTGWAPSYISTLLQPVSALPDRSTVLRSATRSDLQVPRTRLKFGERAFSVAAAEVWNDLPLHVHTISNTDTFKRRLKTYLFCIFYDFAYPSDFI